jgi:hypothetical protein
MSQFREASNSSFIRVFHASPNTPPVDVYVNDKIVVSRLPYRGFSNYLQVAGGRYNVKVYPAGKKDVAVINTDVDIPAKSIITAAAIGTLPSVSILPVLEPTFNRTPGKVYVRFAHLSPNAPNVDVTLPDGRKVFTNIGYKKVSDYIAVNPGTYTFNVNASSNGQRVLFVPNVKLLPNRIYTIYAVGLVGETPPLQVVIPLDGNTYLKA